MIRAFLAFTLTTTLLAAGCIAPPEDAQQAEAAPEDAPAGSTLPRDEAGTQPGRMTKDEPREEIRHELCLLDGISLPDAEPYCARRSVHVEGVLTLAALPALVNGGAGRVLIEAGEPGVWSVDLLVTGRGATEEEAEANARAIDVVTDVGEPGAHALKVAARAPDGGSAGRAQIVLRLPEATLYELRVDTGSGALTLDGLRTTLTDVDVGSGGATVSKWRADTLRVDAGSGRIELDADVRHVDVDFGSGGVSGTLRPFASGAMKVSGGSGDVDLALPETPERGYDLTASTGSGSKDITLKDGRKQGGGDDEDVRFVTTNYAGRAIRTAGEFSTGSGLISITSA